MTDPILAATTVGPRKTEIREYPWPEIAPDAGLLKIEAAGVCGSDWHAYNADRPARIMGHENVGRIHRIGPIAAQRWGLKEGDRVALEEYLPCGYCGFCRSGEFRLCEETEARRPGALRYGTTPISRAPGLWGGYSQFQYLHPNSVFHRLPDAVPAELAAMCLPIGNGFQWAYLDAGAGPGKTILIQGPGQQGLACMIAAKAAGADRIIVSGLSRDAHRLEVAKALGADFTIRADEENLGEKIAAITAGRGVDISLDAAGGLDTLLNAVRAAKKNGAVFFAAAPPTMHPDFHAADLLARRLTLRPCRGHSYHAVELALQYIAAGRFPLELMATHRFGLADADLAIRTLGGEGSARRNPCYGDAVGEIVKPGDIVAVADFSPDTLRSVIAHLEVSTAFEHLVFREAELGAIWSLTGFALVEPLDPAQRDDVLRVRHAILEAYILLTQQRPLDAAQSLQPFTSSST